MCSHSGRTDSKGGHYNRSTGEYHYHNGGHHTRGGNSNHHSGDGIIIFCGVLCALFLVLIIKSKIDKQKEEPERIKRIELNKKRTEILDVTLKTYQPNYNILLPIPKKIRLGYLYNNCKFCKTYSRPDECYIVFLARPNYHCVCISCANKKTSLGIGQPITNFKEELSFARNYRTLLETLITNSNQLTPDESLRPSENELKSAFREELNKRVSNHTNTAK